MASRSSVSLGASVLLLLCITHSLMASAIPPLPSDSDETAHAEAALSGSAAEKTEPGALPQGMVLVNGTANEDEPEYIKQFGNLCMRSPCTAHSQCCKQFYCSFTVQIFGRAGFCSPFGHLRIQETNIPSGPIPN